MSKPDVQHRKSFLLNKNKKTKPNQTNPNDLVIFFYDSRDSNICRITAATDSKSLYFQVEIV